MRNHMLQTFIKKPLRYLQKKRLTALSAPVTIRECAEAVLQALEWQVPIVYPAGTFQGASRKTIDATRFLKATLWLSRHNFVSRVGACVVSRKRD